MKSVPDGKKGRPSNVTRSFLTLALVLMFILADQCISLSVSSKDSVTSVRTTTATATTTTGATSIGRGGSDVSGGGSSIKESTTVLTNSKWILKKHPKFGEDFSAEKHAEFVPKAETIDLTTSSDLTSQDVVIKMEGISVDAFLRTIIDETSPNKVHGGGSSAFPIGATVPAIGYGTIISCPSGGKNQQFQIGDRVMGFLGAQSIAVIPIEQASQLQKIKPRMRKPNDDGNNPPPLTGLARLSAYVGLYKVLGAPKSGQTVVVSAAAGSVGCYVCQLAKSIPGTKVIGMTGSQEKANWLLEELNLDGVINYKHSALSVEQQFDEVCPDGIDYYYDNVGGPLLDLVLQRINRHSRIVICGAISQYSKINYDGKIYGPASYIKLAETSSQMAGFVASHYPLSKWDKFKMKYRYKKVKSYTHTFNGLHQFGDAVEQLFQGGNIGKIIVDVTEKDEGN